MTSKIKQRRKVGWRLVAPVTLSNLLNSAIRLNEIVEGGRGSRWEFDGLRLKDTNEWCDFYVKLKRAIQRAR
jgi:hypothetical protein